MESISIISARSTCGLDPQSLPAPPEARLQSGRQKRNGAAAQFFGAAGYSAATAFLHPVGVADEGVIPPQPSEPYQSDTGELTYDPQRRLFLVRAPAAAAVIGFAGRETVAAGPLEVELAGGGSGFVTLLATALDGNPIPESSRLLLSLPGAALRTQPGSDPVRPQPLVRYPGSSTLWTLERDPRRPDKPFGDLNGGARPVWMERVECQVTIRTRAAAIAVYPLDGAGARRERLPDRDVAAVDGGFRIHLQADGQDPSPWYEVVVE